MSRTSPTAVQNILGTEYDVTNRPSLNGFIDTASADVDDVLANDVQGLMTPNRLELIERWLAAHYYQISDPGYKSRTTAGASGSFNGETTMVFMSTRYGQQACAIDSTGWLAKRSDEVTKGSRRMVQFFVG
jgi:hypothetical protein